MNRYLRGKSLALVFCVVMATIFLVCPAAWAPPSPTGACCLPDGQCSDLTEEACTGGGGIWDGNYSCSELPEGYCTTGACCLEFSTGNGQPADAVSHADETTFCRDDIIESQCPSGLWNPTITCDEEGCCDPTPGACVVDGECQNVPRINCLGEWNSGRCPEQVPTITEWGLVLLSIMLIGSATLVIRRRKRSG